MSVQTSSNTQTRTTINIPSLSSNPIPPETQSITEPIVDTSLDENELLEVENR